MARPDSWMAFYGDDFQADTTHCSAAERGAYMDLLWACWRRGNTLPTAADQLMRLARCTLSEWKDVRATVMAFFVRTPEGWTHKRVGIELTRAATAYDKRVEAARITNEKRKAKRDADRDANRNANRNAKQDADRNVTHNPHSPTEIKSADADLSGSRRKPKRAAQIPHDWKPNEKDTAHASDKGLDPNTITNIGEQFRDHHIAKGTAIKDISAAFRTWVGNHINWHGTGPWPRANAGRSQGNRQAVGSVFAALSENLSAGDLGGQGDDGNGVGRRNYDHRDDGAGSATGSVESPANRGQVIDADNFRRVPESTSEASFDDESARGIDRGHTADTDVLRRGIAALSGGRSEESSEHASEHEPLVAGVERTEGPSGFIHAEAEEASRSADGYPSDFPQELKRCASIP